MSLSSMLGPCVVSSLAETIPEAILVSICFRAFHGDLGARDSRFLPRDEEEADCSAALAVAACSRTAVMNARMLFWTEGRSNVICQDLVQGRGHWDLGAKLTRATAGKVSG